MAFEPFCIGTFAGVPIWVQPEALVVLPLLAAPCALRDPLAALVLMAALVLSILAHEFGHAYAARRFGLRVDRILHVGVAGLCVFEDPGPDARKRCTIAAAGPLANLLIAGVCLAPLSILDQRNAGGTLLGAIAGTNIVLCLGNLLPAFPLDGSVILVELLAARWPRARAVLVTSACGVILSGPMILFCLIFSVIGYPILVAAMFKLNWRLFRESWREARAGRSPSGDAAVAHADRLMAGILAEHRRRRNAIRRTRA